jgi:hypothetical protein
VDSSHLQPLARLHQGFSIVTPEPFQSAQAGSFSPSDPRTSSHSLPARGEVNSLPTSGSEQPLRIKKQPTSESMNLSNAMLASAFFAWNCCLGRSISPVGSRRVLGRWLAQHLEADWVAPWAFKRARTRQRIKTHNATIHVFSLSGFKADRILWEKVFSAYLGR